MTTFTFGQIEDILARMHGIAGHKRTAFGGRLRILSKNGIPTGVTSQRGKAVKYRIGHVFQFALAASMLELGIAPQVAARLVTKKWRHIGLTIDYCFRHLDDQLMPPAINLVSGGRELSNLTEEDEDEFPLFGSGLSPSPVSRAAWLFKARRHRPGSRMMGAWTVVPLPMILNGAIREIIATRYATAQELAEAVSIERKYWLADRPELAPYLEDSVKPWDWGLEITFEWLEVTSDEIDRKAADLLLRLSPEALRVVQRVAEGCPANHALEDAETESELYSHRVIEISPLLQFDLTPLGLRLARLIKRGSDNVDSKA